MIKDILVHVDSTSGGRARLEYAFDLAAGVGARLTGLHVVAPVDVPPYFKPHALQQVETNLARSVRDDAALSEEVFLEAARGRQTPARWRSLEGHLAERICEQGRCADLVIVGQYETEGAPPRRPLYLAEELVLGAGRPILVVPESPGRPFRCERVLIGWDGSREATRAVHDALPLLVHFKPRVDILSFEEPGRAVFPSALADHLSRHGLVADASPLFRSDSQHGATLVGQLNSDVWDLLVIGAYGHPVWMQLLFGGSTQSVLAHAPTPVIISR